MPAVEGTPAMIGLPVVIVPVNRGAPAPDGVPLMKHSPGRVDVALADMVTVLAPNPVTVVPVGTFGPKIAWPIKTPAVLETLVMTLLAAVVSPENVTYGNTSL